MRDWQEEFDKKFPIDDKDWEDIFGYFEANRDSIKSFISNLLEEEREAGAKQALDAFNRAGDWSEDKIRQQTISKCVEVIEEMKDPIDFSKEFNITKDEELEIRTHNRALDQAIKALKEIYD